MSFTDGINRYCGVFEEYMNKDTIQDLREEIDRMTCLVNGFRSENDRLKEENAKLYLSNEELKRENKQLEKININLDNEISELEKEQDNLKQEYKIVINEDNLIIKENARLEEEVERRGYTILSAENKCLKEINSNLNVEIEKLKDQCHKWGKDYNALMKETASFEEEIRRLEEEIKNLERVNGILTRRIFMDKYDYAVTKARELKNERLKFEEEIKKLKEENKNLRTENCWLSELNNENLKLGEEVKKLKEENRQFKLSKNCLCDAKKRLEETNEFLRQENVELQNKLKNRAETKIYQLSAEDFAKTFKGQWTISISPDEVSTSDFTVNNENDKDRLSYYLTYKDAEYDEPFDKIYKYLESYQIERVAIAKMLDEIRAEIKSSEFIVKQFEDMMLNDEE